MDYWPQVITGATAIISGALGVFGSEYVQRSRRRQESQELKQALGFAIAAEIEAYLDLMARRDWVRQAEHLVSLCAAGQRPKVDRWVTEEEQKRDVFPIFTANLSNIGSMGPSCKDLGKFYTSVMAIRVTVTEMQAGKYDDVSLPDLEKLIQEEIDFWHETVIVGRRLIDRLRTL